VAVIEPRGPFSLTASSRFLEGFTPAAHRASGEAGHLHLAFVPAGTDDAAAVCCRQPADPDGPVTIEVPGSPDARPVVDQTRRILSLDIDGSDFPEVGRRDPVIGRLQRRYPGLRPVLFLSTFEAAAWAIIGARISIRQAARTKAAMAEELGPAVEVHGERLHAFPSPRKVATLDAFPGLFGRKAEWLRGIADAVLAGRLDAQMLRSQPPDEARARLRELPGIGPFSADLVLLRGAGEPDALPTAEPRLRRSIALAYDRTEPSAEELEELAEPWRPYRIWVAVLLRTALEDETREIRGTERGRARA